MFAPGASSVEKLQELFPQLNRETLRDVLTQAGDGAFDTLLDLCSTCNNDCSASWSDDSTLLESQEDLSTESHSTGTPWWESAHKSGDEPVDLIEARRGQREMQSLSNEGSFGDAVKDAVGWESIVEGPLSLNDWGIAHVKNGEESVCSSEGLYCSPRGFSKKVEFLAVMFEGSGLEDSTLQGVLNEVDGDLDLAVDRLLERKWEGTRVSSSPWERNQERTMSVDLRKNAHRFQGLDTEASLPHQSVFVRDCPGPENKLCTLSLSSEDGVAGKIKLCDSKLIEKAQALRRQFCNEPQEDFVVDLLKSVEGDSKRVAQVLRDAGLREAVIPSPVKQVSLGVHSEYSRLTARDLTPSIPWSSNHRCAQPPPTNKVEMSQCEFEALYNEERSKVKKLGYLKSEMLRRSAEAYEHGDKCLAKKLSLEGQGYAHQLQVAQQQAAETIFRKRNSYIVNTFKVDLHGMHVQEALLYVRSTIKDFKEHMDKRPSKTIIRFVTGKGNHSPDHIPRLSPALSGYLEERGFPFVLGPGYIDVDLEDVKI